MRAAAELIPIRNDDVFVTWAPAHHDLGLVRFVLAPVYLGRPSHLLEPSISGMKKWLSTIAEVRGTITGAPDFGYRFALAASGTDLPDLSAYQDPPPENPPPDSHG